MATKTKKTATATVNGNGHTALAVQPAATTYVPTPAEVKLLIEERAYYFAIASLAAIALIGLAIAAMNLDGVACLIAGALTVGVFFLTGKIAAQAVAKLYGGVATIPTLGNVALAGGVSVALFVTISTAAWPWLVSACLAYCFVRLLFADLTKQLKAARAAHPA
jgi:hypothetical protein